MKRILKKNKKKNLKHMLPTGHILILQSTMDLLHLNRDALILCRVDFNVDRLSVILGDFYDKRLKLYEQQINGFLYVLSCVKKFMS